MVAGEYFPLKKSAIDLLLLYIFRSLRKLDISGCRAIGDEVGMFNL